MELNSDDHFASFILDLLFAGSSTTANQLLWTLLFLLKNPDSMKKVKHELESVLKGMLPGILNFEWILKNHDRKILRSHF